ncbi:hypothetical protein Plano_1472 [Planococcus sp. PAMC 21323]|uniref:DUF2179 domain-containing protein n=1 Tax=Planococcus sp. PAMC 21323 TaxID=1526927 RepID=UPI000570BE43|nr:DUF2179 domain-containing protein [Planococcus sp. PAMC 21323]AIY05437.1 hypothetical protein Plano_1472 [Planococcus sp. PAMC 21323]
MGGDFVNSILMLIILINVAYMTLFTLRMILVIKGYRKVAVFLSMVEVFIYLMGLTIVLDNLSNPFNLAAYCIGWGIGVYLGGIIENRLALGYIVFDIIVDALEIDLPMHLRGKGYGVTSWTAEGKDGERLCLKVLAKRKNETKLRSFVTQLSPKAFIIFYEPNRYNGGFLMGSFESIIQINNKV